jgi:hypothetical protein
LTDADMLQRSDDGPVVVVLLADIVAAALPWGWTRFVVGQLGLHSRAGLLFFKQLGSGHEAGFGLRPSLSRQALFLVFADAGCADRFVQDDPLVRRYRRFSRELLIAQLSPFSSRGSWSGMTLPATAQTPQGGPVAALTRASIRPAAALAFWRRAPAAERSLAQARGCHLAVGLGEAPFFRQATFSVWDDISSMNAYARTGAHKEAIRASQRDGFFSESMFVRFVPRMIQGRWKGVDYATQQSVEPAVDHSLDHSVDQAVDQPIHA